MADGIYPGLESEHPKDDFIYTELEAHTENGFTPEGIGNFLYSSIHQGPYAFEEAFYALAETAENYEYPSEMTRDHDKIPDEMLPSGVEYDQFLQGLPPHLTSFNPIERSPEGYEPETEFPSSYVVHNRYNTTQNEEQLRKNVSEGLEQMIELVTLSNQDVLELTRSSPPEKLGRPIKTGIIGNPEFSNSAWEQFRNSNWGIHEEVEEMLETYSNDQYNALRNAWEDDHEGLQKLNELNQKITESLFGNTMPLRRGMPLDRLSRRTDEFQDLDYREDIEAKYEFERKLKDEGVTIERDNIDSWTTKSPNWFATPADDIYSRGVILHRNTPIEEIAFSNLTAPQLDDSEYIVEGGDITFDPSQISFVGHPEENFTEEQMIWTYENRP